VDAQRHDPHQWREDVQVLGNFFTIRDVLDKYHPEVVRYLLVSSHYRSAINYSEDNLEDAKGALALLPRVERPAERCPAGGEACRPFHHGDERRLRHAGSLAVLFEMVREINRLRES
jgi:cysteinyl-tRNA synthetase